MSTINEILTETEDNITNIMKHKDNQYLRKFMEAAYLKEKKLNLPETAPPFKINAQEEAQVPPGVFWQFAKKIDIFQRTDVRGLRIETMFIQALESVSAKESEIILAAKDQKMSKLFKGVTLAKLKEVGYFK